MKELKNIRIKANWTDSKQVNLKMLLSFVPSRMESSEKSSWDTDSMDIKQVRTLLKNSGDAMTCKVHSKKGSWTMNDKKKKWKGEYALKSQNSPETTLEVVACFVCLFLTFQKSWSIYMTFLQLQKYFKR